MNKVVDRSIELKRLLAGNPRAAADYLRTEVVEAKDRKLTPILLDLMNPSKYAIGVVNMAALALAEMRVQEAVTPIIQCLRHPKHANSRGTLVYALTRLDWSAHAALLVDLVSDDNFEVREMARVCFDRGSKRLKPEQREVALELLAYRLRTNTNPDVKPWIVHTMGRLLKLSQRDAQLVLSN